MPDDFTAFPRGWRVADPHDPFEVAAGPFYAPERGEPRYAVRIEPRHCNSSGVAHGGMLMTFADLVLCAVAVHGMENERAITVQMDSKFLSAGRVGDLVEGRGEVVRRTGSLCFARGELTVGDRVLLACSAVLKRARRR